MEKHGYEQTPIAEVRAELRACGIVDEEFLESSKTILVQKLLELQDCKERVEEAVPELSSAFDDAEEVEDNVLIAPTEEEMENLEPAFGSENWANYVLSKFRDNELSGDAPTCDGCRRLANELIGATSTYVKYYTPPSTANNGTATVVVSVECFVTNETHPAYGKTLVIEDVADVNKFNTDEPYSRYQSATAKTRAEGRALRQMLQLTSMMTAEETSKVAEVIEDDDEAWEPSDPITRSQVGVLDLKCKQANISVWDFVNSGKKHYGNLREITKVTAGRMIQQSNRIVQKISPVPPGVGEYKSGWYDVKDLDMLV